MRKRITRIFWLTLLSLASRHEMPLGLVLYPIAAATIAFIALSPLLLAFSCWLAWYWLAHGRPPGWLVGVTPRRLRRRLRRRRPRPPRADEAPTAEMPTPAPSPAPTGGSPAHRSDPAGASSRP
jgi:hypothetical protein